MKNKQAFTLIELLVVVLIIAVLAAVALPQYNKAVKRAQGREVLVAIDALDKALADYYLEHDSYKTLVENVGSGDPWIETPVTQEQLNIKIPELKHFWFVGYENTYSHNFIRGSYSYYFTPGAGYHVSFRSNDDKLFIGVHWKGDQIFKKDCSPAELCSQYLEGTVTQSGTQAPVFHFN